MKLLAVGIAALGMVVMAGSEASAQTLTLTLSTYSFTYPSGDPDVLPTVTSPTIDVTYALDKVASRNWQLTLRADADLARVGGGATIPTTETTFAGSLGSGTLTNADQILASGRGNVKTPVTRNITFTLQNRWTYSTGTYTQTIVFTLSAL